ncbi:MAG: hypothetical protein J5I98_36170 [Phaeodactylibacter sp.]|nr:hypothetical protein [Phaeodactylibacter sp.]
MTTFKVVIRKIYDSNGKETGAILIAHVRKATDAKEKAYFEWKLEEYAFDKLFPDESLAIYKDKYIDLPAIVVIKELNELESQSIEI